MGKTQKRPKDSNQLAKFIVEQATGTGDGNKKAAPEKAAKKPAKKKSK